MNKRSSPISNAAQNQKINIWISLALTVLVAEIYAQTFHHSFITLDDPDFFTANTHVLRGLTLSNLGWAFTNVDVGDWFPLTWISILIDTSLFGMHAGAHILMNAVYHAAGAVILFLLFQKLTGATLKSAFAATLFAVHPLRVESVAWAVERKDVLSALFWLMTLFAYLRYCEKKNTASYLGVLIFFACAVMSKAIVVTLPVILLLLDHWPLKRFEKEKFSTLVFEKIPLLIFSLAGSLMAYLPKSSRLAISSFETHPLGLRIANSVIAYTKYLGKTFWPADLSVFYPYPEKAPSLLLLLGSLFLLSAVTGFCFREKNRRPYLLTGWLWFLITLFPVIGLIKFAAYDIANRYTYLPHMGLFLALVWGASDALKSWPIPKPVKYVGAFSVIILLTLLSFHQARYWKNSRTLNEYALRCTPHNFQAHNNLALHYENTGERTKALEHYAKSLEILPRNPDVMNNLANLLLELGRQDEAIDWYQKTLALSPRHTEALINLGLALIQKKQLDDAETFLKRAFEINPSRPKIYLGLAEIKQLQGNLTAAEDLIAGALALDSDSDEINYLAGNLKVAERKYAEAKPFYQKVLERNPRHFKSALNLANIFFIEKDFEKAAANYKQAISLQPKFLLAHLNLGKAYAQLKNHALAKAEYEEVLRLSPNHPEAAALLQKLSSGQ